MTNVLEQQADRSLEVAYNNIFFRLFIWRDMLNELKMKSAWWGVDLGQPQRSPSIEILGWATVEWRRDGWITPHNSFLHMIYRGGIVGLLFVGAIIGVLRIDPWLFEIPVGLGRAARGVFNVLDRHQQFFGLSGTAL